jgi:hypothetical protein
VFFATAVALRETAATPTISDLVAALHAVYATSQRRWLELQATDARRFVRPQTTTPLFPRH